MRFFRILRDGTARARLMKFWSNDHATIFARLLLLDRICKMLLSDIIRW